MNNQAAAKYRVAVVGATGAVGQTMIEILAERRFPVSELVPLASARSVDKTVEFNGHHTRVKDLEKFDFQGIDIALFSAGGSISEVHAPRAAAAGAVVIDNTSKFRYEKDIPLIVPEVNLETLGEYRQRNIIANPNCSTIQLVVALKPLQDAVGIARVNVATYQAVSGAGQGGVNELAAQTAALLNARPVAAEQFTRQIAFNAVPQIDRFEDNGFTFEEMKMVWETRRLLGDESIGVNPTCVRIPVFYGHSEAVNVELKAPLSVAEATALLEQAPGVSVLDTREDGGFPTAVTEGAGDDGVWVGRLRADLSHPQALNLWVVSDNVRKGAALNSVQIAEALHASWTTH